MFIFIIFNTSGHWKLLNNTKYNLSSLFMYQNQVSTFYIVEISCDKGRIS